MITGQLLLSGMTARWDVKLIPDLGNGIQSAQVSAESSLVGDYYFYLHFVMKLLDAPIFAWHRELGALQDGLATGHVAVHLCEVDVKPDRSNN